MRKSRLEDRIFVLERAIRRGDEIIEVFGIKMTRKAFTRIKEQPKGALPVVRDLPDDRF